MLNTRVSSRDDFFFRIFFPDTLRNRIRARGSRTPRPIVFIYRLFFCIGWPGVTRPWGLLLYAPSPFLSLSFSLYELPIHGGSLRGGGEEEEEETG